MAQNITFLDLKGLDEDEIKKLNNMLDPATPNPAVEFPWRGRLRKLSCRKDQVSSPNVHAPEFTSYKQKDCDVLSYKSNPELHRLNETLTKQQYLYNCDTTNIQPLLQTQKSPFQDESESNELKSNDAGETSEKSTKTVNGVQNSQFSLNPSASTFVPQISKFDISSDDQEIQETPLISLTSKVTISNGNVHFADVCNNSEVAACKTESEEASSSDSEIHDLFKKPVIETKDAATSAVDLSIEEEIFPQVPVTRSFADVLKGGSRSTNKSVESSNSKVVLKIGTKADSSMPNEEIVSGDDYALNLGKYLSQCELKFDPVFLQPRGLINHSNWCYVNAPLQAFFACPPFYTLLRDLPIGPRMKRRKSSTPVIDIMLSIAYEFMSVAAPQSNMMHGRAFQPQYIHQMLINRNPNLFKEQQGDAEEVLNIILNTMNEEMNAIIEYYKKKNGLKASVDDFSNENENGEDEDSDEWQVIMPKHKGVVIRKLPLLKTPISDLFCGQMQSVVMSNGKVTSVTVQPFFELQLDIQSEAITSVIGALNQMMSRQLIDGYTCAKTKQKVEAFSHVSLLKLPPILILHLKRFIFEEGNSKKLMNRTDYPLELKIYKDSLSNGVQQTQLQGSYTLFAVLYHEGSEAVKGHYITDIYNYGTGHWIRCDDKIINKVSEADVLSYNPPRVPYLLFYKATESLIPRNLKDTYFG